MENVSGEVESGSGTRLHMLADLVCQAQLLLETLPISKSSYVAWRTTAEGVLGSQFGTNSAVMRQVHDRGAMPTHFYGASMASVVTRLDTERQQRMISMKEAIEACLAQHEGKKDGGK